MSAIKMYGMNGQVQEGHIDFEIGADVLTSSAVFACARAIRVLLQNWRQGTVACKSRGQTAFSNRKPWRQKGTGRARASSLRSPLFRKGGVIFGPQKRVRKLSIGKVQNKNAMASVFVDFLNRDKIACFDLNFFDDKPSTKNAASTLKGAGMGLNCRVVVFVHWNDFLSGASFRNLSNVRVVFYDSPNVYDLMNARQWVFLKKDVEAFKGLVSRWI